MTTIALLGCGALSTVFATNLKKTLGNSVQLVAVTCRSKETRNAFARRFDCSAIDTVEEILTLTPDYVVEFAGGGAVREHAQKILQKTNLIAVSIGALSDKAFLACLQKAAQENGTRLYLPCGAIGGLDLLQTFALMGNAKLSIRNSKPPKSLEGAPYLKGRELSKTEAEQVFTGSVTDAIAGFPKNVNVAVAASLAADAPNAVVTVTSDPAASGNTHCIYVQNDLMQAELQISSKPDSANPRSSTSTAWSVLALLKNLTSSVVIF